MGARHVGGILIIGQYCTARCILQYVTLKFTPGLTPSPFLLLFYWSTLGRLDPKMNPLLTFFITHMRHNTPQSECGDASSLCLANFVICGVSPSWCLIWQVTYSHVIFWRPLHTRVNKCVKTMCEGFFPGAFNRGQQLRRTKQTANGLW